MITLALEFSSSLRSVAVAAVTDGSLEPLTHLTAPREPQQAGLALVHLALDRAGLSPQRVRRILVGLGPGSYTGIRAAIALAQGWRLARPVELAGLGSMDTLPRAAARRHWEGEFLFLVPAQREEFYLTRWLLSPGGNRLIEPLRLAALGEIPAYRGIPLAGPELDKWFPQARPLYPAADGLLEVWRSGTGTVQPEPLEPIYLRETRFVKAPPPRSIPSE